MKREQYAHVHEGGLVNIQNLIREIENVLHENHPVRHQLCKARSDMGLAVYMNRENKFKPQDRWVASTEQKAIDHLIITFRMGDENGTGTDNDNI